MESKLEKAVSVQCMSTAVHWDKTIEGSSFPVELPIDVPLIINPPVRIINNR